MADVWTAEVEATRGAGSTASANSLRAERPDVVGITFDGAEWLIDTATEGKANVGVVC